jgi:hypothetical protein
MPELAERFTRDWYPGFSWWVRDGAGDWHVAVMAEPCARAAAEVQFRLRLVPTLAAAPDTIEVLVTPGRHGVHAIVPVRAAPGMPDT